MNRTQLLNKYKQLYRDYGTESTEESRTRLAYKMVVIALENTRTIGDARTEINYHWLNATSSDSKEIFNQFLKEN